MSQIVNNISVEKALEQDVFSVLKTDWQRLFSESDCSPFSSWEWLSTWYKCFGSNKKLFILKASRENNLIAILPLFIEDKRILGMKTTRLGFIGENQGGADYLDLIAKKSDIAEVTNAFSEFLKAEKSFDSISFENVLPNSAIATILNGLSSNVTKQKTFFTETPSTICPQVKLEKDFDVVLKQSRRFSNYKRRLKQLEKMKGFEFRSITSPDEIGAAFDRFFYLHEKRWEKVGGSELSGHPRLVSFQRDLIANLSNTNLLRFDELWVDGECRASVYGFDNGQTFYYYNAGYDLTWSKLSVGLVLIGLSIKSAIERGNSVYDFLRGDEEYKFDWANQNVELLNVSLSRPTIVTALDKTLNQTALQLRNFSKMLLPSKFSDKLKSYQRNWKRNYQLGNLKVDKPQEGYES